MSQNALHGGLWKYKVATRLLKRVFWLIVLWILPAGVVGQTARLKWVETTVTVASNGMAVVQYAVRYTCQNANLHGFYFEGFQERPEFNLDRCYALGPNDTKFPLAVNKIGSSKYDIVLAQGKSFSNGDITYFFEYGADLRASGQLAPTTAAGQNLTVFNWSPVQWDSPLEHETVVLRMPIALEQPVDSNILARLQFKTERFVNERYRIDHPEIRNANGERIFAIRLHKDNAEARHHFRIQLYLDALYFDFNRPAVAKPVESAAPPVEKDTQRPYTPTAPNIPGSAAPVVPPGNYGIATNHFINPAPFFLLGLGALIFIALFIMTRKHNSMLRAREGIQNASWESEEWVPPKLQMGAFRTPGKVCAELTSLEAGVLMDLKPSQVLALMIENLQRNNLASVVSSNPLKLSASGGTSGDPYEMLLLNSIAADGSLTAEALRKVFAAIAAGMEQKMWNCDPEATREYYRNQVKTTRTQSSSDYFYWDGFWFYGGGFDGNAQSYERAAALAAQMDVEAPDLSQNLSEIKSADACYNAPFPQSACHDACHDACHSACHDACHSACHDACHSACHSACVSGGSH